METQGSFRVSRRRIVLGGGALLVGTALVAPVFDVFGHDLPGVMKKDGGLKQVFLPEEGAKDPVAHSLAENMFWTDILAEHAAFFAMLMPGPELAAQRSRVEKFQAQFKAQFEKVRDGGVSEDNYLAFNESTVEMVKPFVDFKHEMRKAQESGQLKSLVWPLFFDHTAREAERFGKRLEQLSGGNVEIERGEAVKFWTRIMGEHADFVAHLLDPEEAALIKKAMETSDAFDKLHDSPPTAKEPVEQAVQEIIDFKTAAVKGIETGEIKSIIHPLLADHVRREAVKCADELKRAA
ncbi:DUF2935 domain-containing protein [Mesorhizobium sp. M1312]|uniref:DUF2935 domain-containing protein n=1 Tax=unclassified Mesorhizobium TaxID=325217 RepID=UPI00333D5191